MMHDLDGDGTEALSRLVEGLIFASAEPVPEHALKQFLASQGADEARLGPVLARVIARYEDHAVELVAVARGWQFRTRAEIAPALTRVVEKPRRLSRSAMETLAIIAYHQPCTRADIEGIRGVSLSQTVLDALIEDGLIMPRGRKEVPGRPILWGTSSHFLSSFGLSDLNALPRREELLLDPDASGRNERIVTQKGMG
ncbi:SMC-Scp complex subunit ScpB [Asaia lannensis]|uniref:SMC-Scp complex subunit ScpB n=1 Tax=Asaia lannensis NBRC 102526 TaxID=1307926 RepID=A0ABT1CHS1_9PROT|nr:SMC-Scp complex subunit ScpB [Asaia lannensis]MCO6160410.1 SMC-Scp complex subunit ScpB [Asaia lannensis NBRC 102526]